MTGRAHRRGLAILIGTFIETTWKYSFHLNSIYVEGALAAHSRNCIDFDQISASLPQIKKDPRVYSAEQYEKFFLIIRYSDMDYCSIILF